MERYDIIDTQIHLFATMNIAEGLAAIDSLGIQGAIIDEFWGNDEATGLPLPFVGLSDGVWRPIAPGGQMASMRHPDRFRYLLRVNHHDPELNAVVRIAGQDPGCVGLRIEARAPIVAADFSAGRHESVFAAAIEAKLPVFVLAPGNAAAIGRYAASLNGNIVVDHIGLCDQPGMFEQVLELAKWSNVYLKWSHPHRSFDSEYPFRPAIDGLHTAIAAFGADRIMWGSDFTAVRTGNRWSDMLFYIRDSNSLSDDTKKWILGLSARKLLNWSPPANLSAPISIKH